jgi:hypothetical protein
VLTRRKQGNGNLKRKVCEQLQDDPEVVELSKAQERAMGMIDNSPSVVRKKMLGSGLRRFLETFLEWIAAADLYTDLIILI